MLKRTAKNAVRLFFQAYLPKPKPIINSEVNGYEKNFIHRRRERGTRRA